MKSSTRLESAVFHLTPTRTRCDLIITAKGKTEKIASGLLNPFLAQLKTAQDQIAQGGYSIRLEPGPGSDATWFTKGTVERFVRFVSTPEILERVYTLESEILQIEEAIAIQSNNDMGLSTVEDRHVKLVESMEGSKYMPDTNDEKAIVLYKPGAPLPEANGSTGREENSKVQLLRVLETRKTVLQKEQGMAFARAVAAGFDIDHMASLMSFSESFGASRLMDACSRFIDLWKAKHETGQWLEIEAAEAMSSRSDFSSMNASGIMLSNVANKTEDSGKANIDPSGDEKHPKDHQVPAGHQEYFQGHFPHQMYPPWPIHSLPGAVPVFQPYPMQGLPYYPNYPGNGPFFQPPYPSGEDPRSNGGQRVGPLRHSMDSKSSNTESEILEMGASRTRSLDDSELEKEASQSRESRKASGSGKKKSGVVVIRNINYITSKRQNSSGSESQSASESETDEDGAHLDVDAPGMKQNNSKVSTKSKGNHTKSADTLATVNKETFNEEAVGGHWQAFQNCLLRGADEDKFAVDHGMFSGEGKVQAKRRLSTVGQDPLVFGGQHQGEIGEGAPDFHKISGDVTCLPKESNDELLINRDRTRGREHQIDVQFTEAGGKRVGYRRTGNDDFLIHGRETQLDSTRSSDPLALNGFDRTTNNLDDNSSHNLTDESFIVPLRSIWRDQDGTDDRNAIDMDLELPSTSQKADNVNTGYQVNYEPDDLGFMPDRGIEKGSIGYDPALDYEMQVHANNATSVNGESKEAVTDGKRGLKSEKERRSKVTADTSEKKKLLGATRKGKPSKLSPLDEARARAEKLRSFKADLQKVKKEKEAEEIKRLEALKIERQRRILAKSSGIPAKSPLPSPQTRKQLPTKLSPSSQKGSKFSDSEPGSVSPLQRIPIRAASLGSSDSQKPSKVRSIIGSNPVGNKLSHSASSLPESKKESDGATPESKASMARIRRLSEPKMSSSNRNSAVKLPKIEPISKSPVSDEPESKKISAIMNLDRTKAATLPELKIRTSKVPSDLVQNKSSIKEVTQNVIGSKSSVTSEVGELKLKNDKFSHRSDEDDNPVIEKTVVMLECEKPPIPIVRSSEQETGDSLAMNNNKRGESAEVVLEYTAICAPASPLNLDGVDKEPMESHLQYQRSEVTFSAENGSPKFSSTSTDEKPYHAPFARVSSLEDPCTGNSEYGKAPPTSLEMVSTGAETVRAHVTDYKNLKLEKIPEDLEKPRAKESSKGIRKLLKFGKKNRSSADRNGESQSSSLNCSEADDYATNTASSSEASVHTLKNLISQDETPTANATSQKSSRHFSLLSPFRIKTSEKKLTT